MDNLQQYIIDEFDSEITQNIYLEEATKGLWESENVLVQQYFKQNTSLLDIGCGTGRTTIPLYQMGYKVTGIDISTKMIENAQKIAAKLQLTIQYATGNAMALPFDENKFDNAFFSFNGWTQIPYRKNRQQVLSEIFRVIKPGGYYIFSINSRIIKGKYLKFWAKQWFKVVILKKLGFKTDEAEFGDLFFTQQGRNRQYIHIPSITIVQSDIRNSGFKLIDCVKIRDLSKCDPHDESTCFFICLKEI